MYASTCSLNQLVKPVLPCKYTTQLPNCVCICNYFSFLQCAFQSHTFCATFIPAGHAPTPVDKQSCFEDATQAHSNFNYGHE